MGYVPLVEKLGTQSRFSDADGQEYNYFADQGPKAGKIIYIQI